MESGNGLAVICCKCESLKGDNGKWIPKGKYEPPQEGISHTYCPSCAENLSQEARAEARKGPLNSIRPEYKPTK